MEGHSITANSRWIAPVWKTQPYLLVGAGYSVYETEVQSIAKPLIGNGGSEHGFAGRLGGGLDVYLTKNVVLNTEATVLVATQDFDTRDSDNIDALWYVSIGAGLRYQF